MPTCFCVARQLRFAAPRGLISQSHQKISYDGYRFPAEIIRQAIWPDTRFRLPRHAPTRSIDEHAGEDRSRGPPPCQRASSASVDTQVFRKRSTR